MTEHRYRRTLCVACVATLALGLAACSSGDDDEAHSSQATTSTTVSGVPAELRATVTNLEASERAKVKSAIAPEALKEFGGLDAILPSDAQIEVDDAEARVTGDDAIVPATYSRTDKPKQEVLLYFARTEAGWKLWASEPAP